MAKITSQLVLNDNMTAPLRAINSALSLVTNSIQKVQNACSASMKFTNLTNAQNAVNKLGETLNKMYKKSDEAGNSFGTLAKKIGLVAGARKAFDFFKTGIDYVSDLAEVQNVVSTTFGEKASASIDLWAKTTLNAYGINEANAKRYAGTMGSLLKSSGVSRDALSDMSQNMTELAGDMASFYNLQPDVAFEKLRAGISGETEPLKQLGVNMSAANLEAFAMSQGIERSYSSMSQAEQVMLRYQYIMNATSDAQGDFAETSGTFANQSRLLSENINMFAGALSEVLLPILAKVMLWLNGFITFLTANAGTVGAVLFGLAAALGVLSIAWGVHAVSVWLADQANKKLIMTLLSNPFMWVAVAVGVLIAIIYKFIHSVGGIENAINICKLFLISAWNTIKLAFFTSVYWIIDLIDKLKLAWQKAGVAISNFLGDLKVNVLTILQNMINGAIDIINDFIGLLNKIPGVNIGLIEHVTFATTAAAENDAKKQARNAELAAYEQGLVAAKAKRDANIDRMQTEVESSKAALSTAIAQGKAEAAARSSSEQQADTGMGDTVTDISETADNTGSMADSMNENNDSLDYLRDIAEQEAVNRFTTAQVKVDLTNHNSISNDMDLDGVISRLTDEFVGALSTAAEGVY